MERNCAGITFQETTIEPFGKKWQPSVGTQEVVGSAVSEAGERLAVDFSEPATDDTDLLHRYRPLLISVINTFNYHPDEFDDLLQVSSIALVAAKEKFDPDRGVDFSTFLYNYVRGYILRYMGDHRIQPSPLRIPEVARQIGVRAMKLLAKRDQDGGGPMTVDELAVHFGIKPKKMQNALMAAQVRACGNTSFSIQSLKNPDSLMTQASDDSMNQMNNIREIMFSLLNELQGEIIFLKLEGYTHTEISKILHLSFFKVDFELRKIRRAIKGSNELRSLVTATPPADSAPHSPAPGH
jgi:RNA polymerase sigma-B factor